LSSTAENQRLEPNFLHNTHSNNAQLDKETAALIKLAECVIRKLATQDMAMMWHQDRDENPCFQSCCVHTSTLMCPRFEPSFDVPVSYWTCFTRATKVLLSKSNGSVKPRAVSLDCVQPSDAEANLIKWQLFGKRACQQNG
jgi:hypothetical protein